MADGKTTRLIARIAYGLLFALLIPAGLALWAASTDHLVTLPAVHSFVAGALLMLCGGLLMLAGFQALFVFGDGLPMNAFPPQRFVRRGIYRYLGHPIYVGFGAFCFGTAIWFGSPGGLWLVAPVTCLGMTALVLGYEQHDLRARFGNQADVKPLIAIPSDTDESSTSWQRISIYVLVLIPWLLAYEAVQIAGVPADAISSYLPHERAIGVLGWTYAIYATPYLLIALLPLLLHTSRQLRELAFDALFATAFVTLIYIVVPLIAPPRPAAVHTWLDALLAADRATNNTVAAFPSFHVLWAFIAARALSYSYPRVRWLLWSWAAAVAVSCVTTGMHSIADVVAAVPAYMITIRRAAIWQWLRRASEAVANSWHEWRVGPVRIINHGMYAGAGAAVGSYVAGMVSGASPMAVLFVGFCTVLGAGAWAQALEGSSVLLRPFGYYGAIIGGIVSCAIAALFIDNAMLLLAGFAVGAPWVQALGRMRCLVQGCCHGRPADELVGIHYRHPRSRVNHIAGLRGVPVHPTPLYSIISNIVIGLLLARFWMLGASPALVLGLYLILNPISRFVEESYRGEPQTPIVLGLRVYQWMAVLSVLAGITATMIPAPSALEVSDYFLPAYAMVALVLGIITTALMGMDFPASNARFSRLAPV